MFQLHPTLEKDSLPIADIDGMALRLINDARFPWVLIVPMVADVTELHDLSDDAYRTAMAMARRLGDAMKSAFDADKINTAAIGNMVPQLHIHVVARTKDDAVWPGPVWGAGDMVSMDDAEAARRIALIGAALG